jgi:periplasmic protein TonB
MFEDSTFESASRIRTRSRSWMLAALALNSSILLTLILIPLVYPEALPGAAMAFLMAVPPPPAAPAPPPQPQPRAAASSSKPADSRILMPTLIPKPILIPSTPEPAGPVNLASNDTGAEVPGGLGDTFHSQPVPRVIRPEPKVLARVPSEIATGLLLHKVTPIYPAIAKAAHISGAVALAATISKDGRIVNLRVVSGSAMLQ